MVSGNGLLMRMPCLSQEYLVGAEAYSSHAHEGSAASTAWLRVSLRITCSDMRWTMYGPSRERMAILNTQSTIQKDRVVSSDRTALEFMQEAFLAGAVGYI